MDLIDLFPKDGHVQRLYCDNCSKHLDLKFNYFRENVSDIEINIAGLPVLNCESCDRNYLPDTSRFAVIYAHKQALKNSSDIVNITRKSPERNFGLSLVPFIYDSDDYEYIPGLKRPRNDGFLTPVFFNKEILLKYDASPTYRLAFVSTTYGEIRRDNDFSISFGINKNGKIIMWLGDIAKLPNSEQYYLRSENIESDHSIGSEFYDSQIECVFTEPSIEDALFNSRSEFLEICFRKFGKKLAHLDKEVFELAVSFNGPMVDTERERKHIADTLNKIYLESFDNKVLASILKDLGGDPKDLGSIKRLHKIMELSTNNIGIASLMGSFYVLYDLRVSCSHLGSKDKGVEKLTSVKERLGLSSEASFSNTYETLMKELTSSYRALTRLITI